MLNGFTKQFRCFVVTTSVTACLFCASLMYAQDAATQQEQKIAIAPVPVESIVVLEPANTSISFVGIHVGDDPKPRLGGFADFHGHVSVDQNNNAIKSIEVDIVVESIWTEFVKLTAHLKNADFFDVEQFPTAKFVSTEIQMGENGKCTVTGDLTLHGQTSSITFPGSYQFKDGGLLFTSKFSLDRSQFGMDQMLSGVDKAVALEISIGRATFVPEAQEGHGGGKKKQSNIDSKSKRQKVSFTLPNMI